MASDSTTLRPKSLDEIQEAFTIRLGKHSFEPGCPLRFSRSSKTGETLVMHARPAHGLRLQYRDKELSCEFAGKMLLLELADFEVNSELVDEGFLYEFSLRDSSREPLQEKLTAAQNTKHPIFYTRALNALNGLEQALPAESIEAASSAPTDYQVLVEALQTPIVMEELSKIDPLAAAKLRGMVRQHQLVNKYGGAIRVEEVAQLLGITRQGVDKRRREGRLIGLTQGRRGYAYPTWQFERGGTLTHLETVLGALQKHDPWMQLSFFVNPNAHLSESSPLEVLREGHLDPVLRAAATFGEQGPV
jgi:hypothetical protein